MGDYKKLSEDLAALDKKIKGMDKEISGREAKLSNLGTDIKTLNDKKSKLTAQVENLNKTIDTAIGAALKVKTEEIASLKETTESELENAKKIKGEASEEKSAVKTLQADLSKGLSKNKREFESIEKIKEEAETVRQDLFAVVKIIKDVLKA